MAQKVQVLLTCDVHADDTPGTETVRFGVDGGSYEIDVCPKHAEALRGAFASYVGLAHRAGSRSRPGRSRRGAGAGASDSGQIRAWARRKGLPVNERGRLPATIVSQYQAAQR